MNRLIVFLLVLLTGTGMISGQDIYDAVANGDLVEVKKILAEKPDLINVKNEGALTPLNLACERGQAGIVDFLLKQGADPNLGDRENSMPIHLCSISGSIESLDLLLAHGVDIDIQDDNGMTALLFALSRRQLVIADYIIEKGADINLRANVGWAPVHLAIVVRGNDVAKKLIEMGAEVDVSLETGMTPLHSAVSFGNTEMVKLLVENGADIEVENNHGEQPLAMAVNPNTYEALVYLAEHGADLNDRNGRGAHLLHNIAGRGTAYQNAGYLMEKGVDVNIMDDFGRTPLYFTTWSEDPDGMSKYLILHGANVNPVNCKSEKTGECFENFSTPLHGAARNNQLLLCKNLVMNGAKVNVFSDEGLTPLHEAVESGNPEIVTYLLKNGAFIDIHEKNSGSTELHLAVAMGYVDISDILIRNGADLHATDYNGKTPLDYALYYGHNDLAYDLLAAGADDNGLGEYLTAPAELDKALAFGEAQMWFLGHSGWAVRTQNHFLVFDYFCNPWGRKSDDSCLASGYILPEEIKDLDVTVFSTHAHGDHYDPRIFSWEESIPDIEYVLCWDQPVEGHDYTLIPVHEEASLDDMEIYVNHSTDLGGGYLVEVDGLTIFYMGDHANGADDLMAEFTDEIDIIRDKGYNIDILFGGITGCSLGEPHQVKKGLYYTLDQLQPDLFIPMHNGCHSFRYKTFVETAIGDGYEMDMWYPVHKGDRTLYSKEKEEQITKL